MGSTYGHILCCNSGLKTYNTHHCQLGAVGMTTSL
jgi:hypothetical protein